MKLIVGVLIFFILIESAQAGPFFFRRSGGNRTYSQGHYSQGQSQYGSSSGRTHAGGSYSDCYDYVRRTGGVGKAVSNSIQSARPGDVLHMQGFNWGGTHGSNHWARVESVDGNGNVTISHSNMNGYHGKVVETHPASSFRGSVTVHR